MMSRDEMQVDTSIQTGVRSADHRINLLLGTGSGQTRGYMSLSMLLTLLLQS